MAASGTGANAQTARNFPSLEEAAAAEGEEIHLALPAGAVLMERMRLPSVDRAELDGMMRLQLEKTLPFGADEIAADFEIIGQTETESELLALAVNNAQLDALCEPLRAANQLPEKVTLFAAHLAANAPPSETVCAIFREQETIVLIVAQNAKLTYAQTVLTSDAHGFFEELPQTLLTAELDGVPMDFNRVQLDQKLSDRQAQARELFPSIPIDLISLDAPLPEPAMNLAPAAWLQERRQIESSARTRSQLIFAGAIYLALLLCAAGYVIWLQRQVTQITQQAAAAAPEVQLIGSRKARWSALAPAIDPTHYAVEILYQVSSSLPSPDIRITAFDQNPTQFTIEGEAPTAAMAIDFGERLKKNPDLQEFSFTFAPPAILPNEHAQFRIFGKL